MIDSIEFDQRAFEASTKGAERSFRRFEEPSARKTLIEAANAGLANALRRHFAMREREAPKSSGFPWFGQTYPKRHFWYGTRGDSVADRIRVTLSSPARLAGRVSINSPALAHKLAANPPEIRPKGGRRYLAIPANPTAAAWAGRPRDFPGGLRFAFSKTPDGNALPSLVAAGGGAYWLVHKARTRRDPNAMPSHGDQSRAATSAVSAAVRQILARRPVQDTLNGS